MRVRPPLLNDVADLIEVGQVGAPYGIKGWNHARSFTSPFEALLSYSPLYLKYKEGWAEVELEEGRKHGEALVIKLKGVEDRDRAATFTQMMIAIRREQRASLPDDEFYWSDLEGLAVELLSGESWGHIRYLYDNAGTDIVVIEHDGKEYQVPFLINDTVRKVDLVARKILLDWSFDYPEG